MIEVLKQALEAFRKAMQGNLAFDEAMEAFKKIEQAIAELESQEPVAWISPSGALYRTRYHAVANAEQLLTPLFTHPPQRSESSGKPSAWVGLTDEEAQWLYDNCRTPSNLIDMVEAKLKERNS